MKRWSLFFILFFTLSGCFDNNEFTSVLENDPLSQKGDIFISESGEEYGMGCENSNCYGFKGAAPDGDKTLKNLTIPDNLPATFDLSSFLPEVGNQGRLGSCTAWATAYYGRSLLSNFSGNSSRVANVRLSPSYIYNQLTKGQCKGVSIGRSMQLLVDEGASEWDIFPYQSTGCNV